MVNEFRDKPYDQVKICPRCNLKSLPIGYPGALSRVDNHSEICSEGSCSW
jgi:hypothetical protein